MTTQAETPTVRAALTAVGLPELTIIADPIEAAMLAQAPGCRVSFAQAVQSALEAFLCSEQGSSTGHDSAFEVVRDDPESFGLEPDPDNAAITEALRKVLQEDPRAKLILLTSATLRQESYHFPPEYGESISENWVFRIFAPSTWPFLQWAIVDLRGERPAYSYLFD
ncbi:MAG: hypothetical protein EOM24_07285 [Chloroflexia bacterium]|nr:hypothetical protein [Chloroflexia bacterium]